MKLKITYRPLAALVRNERNARNHDSKQIESLKASIREFGFTNPILVDSDDVIIAGHGRLQAALELQLKDVPVINLGHLSEAQKRAYAIADNKIPLGATWDEALLRAELKALEAFDFDLSLTGFDGSELDRLLADANAISANLPSFDAPSPSAAPSQPSATYEMEEEEEQEGDFEDEAPAPTPKASDRDFSNFDIVMPHFEKLLVVDTLNAIRQEKHFETIAEALVWLCKRYNEGEKDA